MCSDFSFSIVPINAIVFDQSKDVAQMLEAILALTLVPPSGFVRHAGSWRKWCLARLPVRSVMFLYTNNRPFDVFSKSYYAAS